MIGDVAFSVLVLGLFVVSILGTRYVSVPLWRGNSSMREKLQKTYPALLAPESLSGDLIRAFPVMGVATAVLSFGGFVASLGDLFPRGGQAQVLLHAVGVPILMVGLFVIGLPMQFMVMMFNRPRFVVPPWLRDEPGWVTRLVRRVWRKLSK